MDTLKAEPVANMLHELETRRVPMLPSGESIPTSVYENNLNQMGELEPDEIKYLIRAYSFIFKYKKDREELEKLSIKERYEQAELFFLHIDHQLIMGEYREKAIDAIESELDIEYEPENTKPKVSFVTSTEKVETDPKP